MLAGELLDMTEAEILFADFLNCSRLSLYLNRDLPLDKYQAKFLSSVLERRISGEPLQYILKRIEFMGLEFVLTKDVLIPRPETEILVENAVRCLSVAATSHRALRILDIGTGSGCIAVSLAKLLSDPVIDAIDISGPALIVARKNAGLNKVSINFMQSDLFNHQDLETGGYDLIISNPPYIPTGEIRKLQPEIRFEPFIALDGGSDGLDFYRRIIKESPRYLREGGLLIMEMGLNQIYALKNIIEKSSTFGIVEITKDYNNIDRVIVLERHKENG